MSEIIRTFLLAMTPIGELRVAIPVALMVYKLPLWLAYVVSVVGNLMPAVFLLLLLEPVSAFLSQKSKFFQRFFVWLFARTGRKADGIKNRKYIYLALAIFVAIPLPMTGAWTGALIAFLLGMPFVKSFLAITLGVMAAGGIVSALTLSGIAIEKYFGLPTLLVIAVVALSGWIIFRRITKPGIPKLKPLQK